MKGGEQPAKRIALAAQLLVFGVGLNFGHDCVSHVSPLWVGIGSDPVQALQGGDLVRRD